MERAGTFTGTMEQLISSNLFKREAFRSGSVVLTQEEHYFLLMCAANNAEEKHLARIHEIKEYFENLLV